MELLEEYKKFIFYVDPKKIVYCTYPSKYCEFTQFGLDKIHPHAGRNRGFFKEDDDGKIKIINTDWDKPGIEFEKLPEHIALLNHYNGKQKWRNSEFAKRVCEYIKSGNIKINFNREDKRWKTSQFNFRLLNYIENNKIVTEKLLNQIILERENEIDLLIDNILKNGINPCQTEGSVEYGFVNNISINITNNLELFFNNRGHHRLSIAKILKLKLIPVKIAIVKNILSLKKFISFYNEKKN